VVYLVKKKDTNELLALKSQSIEYLMKQGMLRHAIMEAKLLRNLSSPFIVQLRYAF
jgi:serine/threonine protein kinase